MEGSIDTVSDRYSFMPFELENGVTAGSTEKKKEKYHEAYVPRRYHIR